MTVSVHHGDSREVLKAFPDAHFDSVVCDPPYGIAFMGKRWDTGETAFDPLFWVEVMRVLKPGGHLIAASGTRTYHRLAVAIEDAGFEMRDMILWLYGSGFPKSHDVSKGIDKAAGERRAVVGVAGKSGTKTVGTVGHVGGEYMETAPATDAARQWQGWGTALKPACEPWVLARKPLARGNTVAANVLQHGTGALNIDASRIGTDDVLSFGSRQIGDGVKYNPIAPERMTPGEQNAKGRWPANVIHDGSEEVTGAFPETGAASSGARGGSNPNPMDWGNGRSDGGIVKGHDDAGGSAARFFYAVEKDAHCDLCRAPLTGKRAIDSSCNVNAAAPLSSTQSTLTDAIARADATVSSPPAPKGKRSQPNARATSAENRSSGCRQQDSGSVRGPAPTSEASSLALNVRSAADMCGSCVTAIAQSLAATRRGQSPASLPCPDSIDGRSWQILTDSLALHVAGRESTDTTTTIPSLKLLLGSVFHAIGDTTRPAKSAALENTESGPKRFHYSSKADAADRCGSKHPTVKPVDLMAYLVRLVTPPAGLTLDPFAGSGSTGMACLREGFDCVLIEREAQYVADIHARLAHVSGEDAPLFAASNAVQPSLLDDAA